MSSFDYFKLPCPTVPLGGCSICGPNKCVTSSNTVFSYPGQPAVQCGLLEKAGHGGIIPLDQCTTLSELVQDKCDCENGIPMSTRKPTRAPTRAPTRPPTRAPTRPPTNPTSNSSSSSKSCPDIPDGGCSICGPDKCVTSEDTIFSYPGQPAVKCGLLEKAGHGGIIPLDQCTTLSELVKRDCKCKSSIPDAPDPTKKPTRAPTRKPTREPTRAPEPAGPVQCPAFMEDDGCSICGPGKCITDEDAIFSYPGQPAISCKLLEEAGRSGIVPQAGCQVLPQLVQDICKCKADGETQSTASTKAPTRPPTRAPTRKPTRAPTPKPGPVQCPTFLEDNGCSICGPDKCITAETAVFSYPGQPAIQCGLLEEAGRSGLIPLDQCGVLPQLVKNICKCKSDGDDHSSSASSNTRAPTRSPTRPPTRAPTRAPTRPPTDEPFNPFTSQPMPVQQQNTLDKSISTNPPIGQTISAELFAGPNPSSTSSDAAVVVLGILLMLVGIGTVVAAYFVLQKKNTKKTVKDASSLGIQLDVDGTNLARDQTANAKMSKALKEAIEEDPDLF